MGRLFYIFRLEWDEYFIYLDWNGTNILYIWIGMGRVYYILYGTSTKKNIFFE